MNQTQNLIQTTYQTLGMQKKKKNTCSHSNFRNSKLTLHSHSHLPKSFKCEETHFQKSTSNFHKINLYDLLKETQIFNHEEIPNDHHL